jgi:hypothetical protein
MWGSAAAVAARGGFALTVDEEAVVLDRCLECCESAVVGIAVLCNLPVGLNRFGGFRGLRDGISTARRIKVLLWSLDHLFGNRAAHQVVGVVVVQREVLELSVVLIIYRVAELACVLDHEIRIRRRHLVERGGGPGALRKGFDSLSGGFLAMTSERSEAASFE